MLVAGDTEFEEAETFSVTLKNPSTGLILSLPSVSVTIQNDDERFLTATDDTFTGTLEADVEKSGRVIRRKLNDDRSYTAPDGGAVTLNFSLSASSASRRLALK